LDFFGFGLIQIRLAYVQTRVDHIHILGHSYEFCSCIITFKCQKVIFLIFFTPFFGINTDYHVIYVLGIKLLFQDGQVNV